MICSGNIAYSIQKKFFFSIYSVLITRLARTVLDTIFHLNFVDHILWTIFERFFLLQNFDTQKHRTILIYKSIVQFSVMVTIDNIIEIIYY